MSLRAVAPFHLEIPRAALVITDPQVDFLSAQGARLGTWWGRASSEHDTVQNIERLLKAAKRADMVVAISPHYYYPSDHRWGFGGPLEEFMYRMCVRRGRARSAPEGSGDFGADFLPQYRPYLLDGKTIIARPAPDVRARAATTSQRQLRALTGFDQVILAGMSANLCLESHLRALLERGFEVAVVARRDGGRRAPRRRRVSGRPGQLPLPRARALEHR